MSERKPDTTMPEFKLKTKTIEAIKFRKETYDAVRDFTNAAAFNLRDYSAHGRPSECDLQTADGVQRITEGDYIIKTVHGFFKSDAVGFANDYEAV